MTLRGIVESRAYAQCVAQLSVSARRLDELLVGLTWSLARDPTVFDEVVGTPYRGMVTDPFPGVVQYLIFFTFDDERVTLEWIEEYDSDQDEPA